MLIHIDMADTVGMTHDRYLCIVHNIPYKGIGTSGNEKVDILVAFQQAVDIGTVFHQGKKSFGDAGFFACGVNHIIKSAVGLKSLASAFQDGAVTAFQAEGGDLDQGVGARFEDDSNYPNWTGDFMENEIPVQFPLQKSFKERIR